jgi:holo-[acyl-carrier protein] synthase
MILGIGTDLTEVQRIQRSIGQFGDRFLRRVYTQHERAYANAHSNTAERFAARFAAKEAGFKALGAPWRDGVTWHDFEVVNDATGRPNLSLHGVAKRFAQNLGVRRILLSLTHTRQHELAFVILEGEG